MTTAAITRAVPADAEALAEIGRATFTEAFGHLYPPADLQAFLDEAHALARVRDILGDARNAAWLARVEARTVGYALAGPCALPHPAVAGQDGELKRIYVLGPWRGGLGSRLMRVALDWLKREGRRPIWVGVWSQNHAAQRLYERAGFRKVGDYRLTVGKTQDDEFILRRD